MLFGQQTGYTKLPCFIHAKDQLWKLTEWPKRKQQVLRLENTVYKPLAKKGKFHFLLYTLDGQTETIYESPPKRWSLFSIPDYKFLKISIEKMKEEILVGSLK